MLSPSVALATVFLFLVLGVFFAIRQTLILRRAFVSHIATQQATGGHSQGPSLRVPDKRPIELSVAETPSDGASTGAGLSLLISVFTCILVILLVFFAPPSPVEAFALAVALCFLATAGYWLLRVLFFTTQRRMDVAAPIALQESKPTTAEATPPTIVSSGHDSYLRAHPAKRREPPKWFYGGGGALAAAVALVAVFMMGRQYGSRRAPATRASTDLTFDVLKNSRDAYASTVQLATRLEEISTKQTKLSEEMAKMVNGVQASQGSQTRIESLVKERLGGIGELRDEIEQDRIARTKIASDVAAVRRELAKSPERVSIERLENTIARLSVDVGKMARVATAGDENRSYISAYEGEEGSFGSASAYSSTGEAKGNEAVIRVKVPAEAVIWFDGERTTQTGTLREFVSPPLAPGKEYQYNLRARWVEGGRPMTKVKTITVQAARETRVDLTESRFGY